MAKLPSGTRKRNDGTLEKRFTMDGIRYSVYASTVKDLAEKEQEMRMLIRSGRYKKNDNITLDEYFKKWIERKALEIKGNSRKTYISIYNNHFSKELGKYKLNKIERRQILELQSQLAKDYSITTCNYVLSVLKIILNDAVKDEIITRNPATIRNLKTEKKAAETYHRALTKREQELFVQESKQSYYYELFAFALCTGMRMGEITALTWGDIDYKKNVIHISKTITFEQDGKITTGTPKTFSGKRDIPLTPNIIKVLKQQREKMGNIYGFDRSHDLIFTSIRGNGGYIYNQTINYEIKRIIRQLNHQGEYIEVFTAHAFRDTFATRYIEQGGSMQTLKKILGHSSIQMTMDLYAHVLPDTLQDEMLKVIINI